MIQYVYRVSHVNPINEDLKLIGACSTRKKAEQMVALYSTYEGFSDSPDTFFVQRYTIDEAHWKSGYATKIIPRTKE